MTGIPQNLREIRGYGYSCLGNTAGMELRLAGIPRVWNLLLREIRGCALENVQSSLWMDCCFCMDSSRNTNHSALIVTVCYTYAPRMLLLQRCDAEILFGNNA